MARAPFQNMRRLRQEIYGKFHAGGSRIALCSLRYTNKYGSMLQDFALNGFKTFGVFNEQRGSAIIVKGPLPLTSTGDVKIGSE